MNPLTRLRDSIALAKYQDRVADASRWYDRELDRIERLPEPQQGEERAKVETWFAGVLANSPVRDD